MVAILIQPKNSGTIHIHHSNAVFSRHTIIIEGFNSKDAAERWLVKENWRRLDETVTPANPAYNIWITAGEGKLAFVVPSKSAS